MDKLKFGISQISNEPPKWIMLTLNAAILLGGFLIAPSILVLPEKVLSLEDKNTILALCGVFVSFVRLLAFLLGVEIKIPANDRGVK